MVSIQTPTSPINFVRTGPRGKPPVVLLGAVGLDLTYWGAQIEALCDSYDVLAVDVPNQDGHHQADAPVTFEGAATSVVSVIQSADIGPAHIVGLSVGGMIAQTFALAHPHLVRSLSLLGTCATFSDEGRAAVRERARLTREQGMEAVIPLSLKRWFTPRFTARRPDVIERIVKTLLARDPAIHAAMWDMVSGVDVEARLPELSHPTLVVVGQEDTSTPPAASRQTAQKIAGAQLHIIPGLSHLTTLEAPQTVNALLQNFFASC